MPWGKKQDQESCIIIPKEVTYDDILIHNSLHLFI